MSDHLDHAHDPHPEGLAHDLAALVGRRRALSLLGGAGLVAALAACAPDTARNEGPRVDGSGSPTGDAAPSQATGGGEIPEETNGPFPADGSNGVNVLTESGVVRKDITSSFGGASGTAEGIPLAVTLTVVDVSSADDPGKAVSGAAIYVWHCSREGDYSLYSSGFEDQNWLRGVQETDDKGRVTFTTIFPGCYAGRWPHIHFEVYPSLADATRAQNRQRTSQLAFPEDVCDDVYATDGYESSVTNFDGMSLGSDNVFSDGHSLQLAKVTGSVRKGYTAALRVPI
jgi:protocatechuate 3,4-dioxygenase beta subunit